MFCCSHLGRSMHVSVCGHNTAMNIYSDPVVIQKDNVLRGLNAFL